MVYTSELQTEILNAFAIKWFGCEVISRLISFVTGPQTLPQLTPLWKNHNSGVKSLQVDINASQNKDLIHQSLLLCYVCAFESPDLLGSHDFIENLT